MTGAGADGGGAGGEGPRDGAGVTLHGHDERVLLAAAAGVVDLQVEVHAGPALAARASPRVLRQGAQATCGDETHTGTPGD